MPPIPSALKHDRSERVESSPYPKNYRPNLRKDASPREVGLEVAFTNDDEFLEKRKGKDRCGPCFTGKKGEVSPLLKA
jgi:hypothetical protein